MTADVSSAAAGDTTDPQALATIPEDYKYDDAANAKEMDTKDEETTENLDLTESHILVTTANKPHKACKEHVQDLLHWAHHREVTRPELFLDCMPQTFDLVRLWVGE